MPIETGKTKVICNMCGESEKIKGEFNPQMNVFEGGKFNWVHKIKLRRPGYGSFLDTCDIESIYICDSCLKELFEEMVVEPEIKPNINI